MQFTLELTQKNDGQYRAFCSELGISVIDPDPDTAISRLQEIIFEDFFESSEMILEDIDQAPYNRQEKVKLPQYVVLRNDDEVKTFYLPKHTSVH